MSGRRNLLVDSLKGYACFLVVFGHVIMGVRKGGISTPAISVWYENFIWTYHVALFMFLSGFVYHVMGEWNKKGSRINFIKDKLLDLGIPYFVFSMVYIIINSVVGGNNVNNAAEISDILTLWNTPIAQYWFLYNLFFLFVSFVFLGKWFKNWQITLLLFVIEVILNILHLELPKPLSSCVDYALMFGTGTCMNDLVVNKWKKGYKFALIIVHIVLTTITWGFDLNNIYLVKICISMLGIFSSVALISMLTKQNHIQRGLLFICKYSFQIYLLHTIFTAGIRIVLMKVNITNYLIHILVGLIAGFLFPIIIAAISEKIDLFNIFFYPSKVMRKLKNKGE